MGIAVPLQQSVLSLTKTAFMTTLNAKNLSLSDVHNLLGFQRQYNRSFTCLLSLEPLTAFERSALSVCVHPTGNSPNLSAHAISEPNGR